MMKKFTESGVIRPILTPDSKQIPLDLETMMAKSGEIKQFLSTDSKQILQDMVITQWDNLLLICSSKSAHFLSSTGVETLNWKILYLTLRNN